MAGESNVEKSRLVIEICSISKRIVWCAHSRKCSSRRAPFIDWYRILGVDEDSGLDVIRKRYHKLALQLHPDKNKHPKAELAFKLVSEAYACLSDVTKRKAFESEKSRNFCWECNRIPYTNTTAPGTTSPNPGPKKPHRNPQRLHEVRARFTEEARVIENCLKINSILKKELPRFVSNSPDDGQFGGKIDGLGGREEFPVFDPSHYVLRGYPHLRTRGKNANTGKFWGFCGMENSCGGRIGGNKSTESPIFMGRTSRSRSSCVRS